MAKVFSKVIVVGASSGIGEALALELGARHAPVALVARRAEALQRVAHSVEAAGGRATILPHDVRQRDQAGATLAHAVTAPSGLDCLIYAAGLMERVREGEFDLEKDARMLEVNLLGAVAWGDLAAAHFQAQR